MSSFALDSRVFVAPFTRSAEGGEVVIGRPDEAVFVAVPPDALDVLDHLADGKTVGEARDLYALKYGEILDILDLLESLEREGFVAPTRQEPAGSDDRGRQRVRYHFTGIRESTARRIFSAPSVAFCSSVIALAAALVALHPALIPTWKALFFTRDVTATYVTTVVFGYVCVFIHEMGHLLAARAVGVPSRMGIGNRLWILVAETDVSGLWSVEPRRRYLPFLAGPLVDAFGASVIVLIRYAQTVGWIHLSAFTSTVLGARLMGYLLGLSWQCYFFVRTDLYYVIANALRCKNLMGDTETYIRNTLSKLFSRIRFEDQSHLPARERRTIRWYALVWLAGRVAALGVLVFVSLPLLWSYARLLVSPASVGASASARVEVAGTSLFSLGPQAIGLWLWIRGLLARRKVTT